MRNYFKRYERFAFVVLSALAGAALGIAVYSLAVGCASTGKWFATSGLLATVAGLVQLEVSGLFQKIFERYSDETKYPYGPPSHITREIIDNPDRPVATWLRNACYFNPRTGFWLIIVGTLLQLVGTWL